MGHGITYFGVNVHLQNGRSEKAIRDLQTRARIIIIHAKGRWPEAIHMSMWPYVLLMDIHVNNNVPNAADASSHQEAFTRIGVSPKPSDYHTFGCPAYIITIEAKQGRSKKYEGCSVLDICLWLSNQHAESVSLVLNLTTGNASPQIHVGNDNFFETTRYNRRNKRANINWQKLSGIDHVGISENKENVKSSALARSKTISSSGVTHEVELANQVPIFEVSSGNSVKPVTSHGSSPSTEITNAAHKDTTVPTSSEPPNRPQAQAAPQGISDIYAPGPEPITVPTDPHTNPPLWALDGGIGWFIPEQRIVLRHEVSCHKVCDVQVTRSWFRLKWSIEKYRMHWRQNGVSRPNENKSEAQCHWGERGNINLNDDYNITRYSHL